MSVLDVVKINIYQNKIVVLSESSSMGRIASHQLIMVQTNVIISYHLLSVSRLSMMMMKISVVQTLSTIMINIVVLQINIGTGLSVF